MDIINAIQILEFCGDTKDIWILIGKVVWILQIAIPVIIILLGTLDLGKAVMAGEEKKIKEAQNMFIKRLIYGVAVFFVVMIVKAVFGFVSNATSSVNSTCFSCVAHNGKC